MTDVSADPDMTLLPTSLSSPLTPLLHPLHSAQAESRRVERRPLGRLVQLLLQLHQRQWNPSPQHDGPLLQPAEAGQLLPQLLAQLPQWEQLPAQLLIRHHLQWREPAVRQPDDLLRVLLPPDCRCWGCGSGQIYL